MNNHFSFEFADAVIVRESVGNVKIGNVSEGEAASVDARCDSDGTIALDFTLPRGRDGKDGEDGKDGKDGDGITPALFIREIKTEPVVNYNGSTVGQWKEYFMSDGTVRAETVILDSNYNRSETYTDFAFLTPAYGPNCFNDPQNFTVESVYTELYSCSKQVILQRVRSSNCAVYPTATLLRHGGALPDGTVKISYKIIVEGREKTL